MRMHGFFGLGGLEENPASSDEGDAVTGGCFLEDRNLIS